MANTLSVGSLVYESYQPNKCGKVVEDLGPPVIERKDGSKYISPFHTLKVKWLVGGTTVVDSGRLNDFEQLVEDHRRKFDKHSATLERLRAL